MLGDRLLVGTGLVANQDAGFRAGVDVDHVVAGAQRADGEEVGRLGNKPGVWKPGFTQLRSGAGVIAVRAAHVGPVVGDRRREVTAEHVNVGALIPDRRGRRIEAVMEVDDLLDVRCHAVVARMLLCNCSPTPARGAKNDTMLGQGSPHSHAVPSPFVSCSRMQRKAHRTASAYPVRTLEGGALPAYRAAFPGRTPCSPPVQCAGCRLPPIAAPRRSRASRRPLIWRRPGPPGRTGVARLIAARSPGAGDTRGPSP